MAGFRPSNGRVVVSDDDPAARQDPDDRRHAAAVEHTGMGVIVNTHSTDVQSTYRVRACSRLYGHSH